MTEHSTPVPFLDSTGKPHVSLCFVCERVAGTLQLSDESTDIGYFPIEALPEPMMPSHRIRLKDVLAQQREPFIR